MNRRIRCCCSVATIALISVLVPSLAQGDWSFQSVQSFGAVGDGIHDDTGAIQAAIAADTVVYFPPGTYLYVGPMVLPEQKSYRLYGDGPGVSTILFTGNPTTGILATNRGLGTLNMDGLTLQANSYNCGTAISASFDPAAGKFHTATIHNVQIKGSSMDHDGITGFYWSNGISLYQAQNSVIDKVEISGNRKDCDHAPPNPTPCATPPTTTPSQIGILWASSNGSATTGLQLSNLEIQHFNTALKTDGWVEGVYLSGFELTFCGQANLPTVPVVDFNTTTQTPARTFHLFNGHMQGFATGLRARNISDLKISKVHFAHNAAPPDTGTGNAVELDNCTDATVSKCSFLGDAGGLTSENGIVLNNSRSVRIAENYFSAIAPTESGCGIVIDSNSAAVRIVNNVFGDLLGAVLRPYCDAGQNTYYRGNNMSP
jgi:polygalacturonase